MAKDEFDDELEGLEDFGDEDFGDLSDDDLGDMDFGDLGDDDLGDTDFGDLGDDDFTAEDTVSDDLGDTDFGDLAKDDLGDDDFGDTDFGDLGDDDFTAEDTASDDLGEADFRDLAEDDLGEADFGDLAEDDLGEADFGDLAEDDLGDDDFEDEEFGREGLEDDPFGEDDSDEGDLFEELGGLEDETEEETEQVPRRGFASQEMGKLVELTQEKKPFYIMALITILIGTALGGGALWLVYEHPEETASLLEQLPVEEMQEQMEFIQDSAEKGFADLTGMAHTSDAEMIEPIEIKEDKKVEEVKPKPPPRIKKHKYYVRVAQCIYQECVNDYRSLLKQYGIYSRVVTSTENTPVFEIVSRNRFNASRAASWVQRVNHNNRLAGQAFRKNEGNRYRISMGLFPNQQRAQHLQSHLNLIFAGQLAFEVRSVQQKTLYYRIHTKSFASKQQAVTLHNRLMDQNEKFQGAELITQTYYL